MQFSGLNTNHERAAFWRRVHDEKGLAGLSKALAAIDAVSAQVLTWHYFEGYSFAEITTLLKRSISIVRNHHNRGIFELQQYYLNRQASPGST